MAKSLSNTTPNIHSQKVIHLYFYNDISKCSPSSIIVSRLHLMINCEKGRIKCCKLTSNMLPHYFHYFVTQQLFTYVSQNLRNVKNEF